jgi:hypothetical protein
MAFVEHTLQRTYPPFVWAKDISVTVCGDELEVSGTRVMLEEEGRAAPNFLREYRQAVSRYGPQKRQGKNSPHIQFANAETDQELIKFVQRFGPVVVSSLRSEERPTPQVIDVPGILHDEYSVDRTILVARQVLAELRSEHRAYRAALNLVSELQLNNYADSRKIGESVTEIVANISQWPGQWEREQQLLASGVGFASQPPWLFGRDNLRHVELDAYYASRERSDDSLREALVIKPVAAGHSAICELVNAFSSLVYTWGKTPIEAPHWDLTCGIRPLLYYILRREYLLKGGSIGICRNTDCRKFFEIERFGQEFCSEECSRLQRQREYWKKRGKTLRKRRSKKNKKLSVGTNHERTGRVLPTLTQP